GVNDGALELEPAFESAFTGDVVERPLHGRALHVKRVAVVVLLEQMRAMAEAIADLNGIPTQTDPVGARVFVANGERDRAAVVGHLDLTAPVEAVDEVGRVAGAREPG